MSWWIWILMGLALLALEALVPGGVIMAFFGVAALLVGALVGTGMGGPLWFQWLLFSVVSVVSLLTLRGPILRRMNAAQGPDTVDSLVGQQVLAIEDLAPGAVGRTELRGTAWTTENIGERKLARGQHGVVERVEGLKLFVRVP